MSRLLALPLFGLVATLALGVPPEDPKAKPPAKGSPEEALLQVRIEGGLKADVWASEPLLLNPVAFCFDEKGRVYVAEAHRLHSGVTDTRSHMYWMEDDLANRTVADEVAMFKRDYPGHKPYLGFEKSSDLVRMVWDSNASGKADQSSVFADGFNKPEDGLAAGVLARKGDVYLTNIPSLYKLRDTKGANKADVKEVLSTGYGLRVQFLGHDMHGLRMGPDGKLYFSIGDRGLNVVTKEGRQLANPDSGAVLRCNPDGSALEIVHTGLRNPQELAFDDFGNLFTYDNNCDSGDAARWVQIVEGGDSGWRCGYQYGTLYHPPGVPQGNRGPWNVEKIWHVPGPNSEPPAYIVPALKHFGNGPSGLTHYPGVGLNDRYKDHFFACDFTSNAGSSKIWALGVKPKGASFEVTDLHPFVQGMVPTDCEFGPDGAFYWSDWVGGWEMPRKGRIFRVADPVAMKNPAVAEAKKLLADGFEKRNVEELEKLLGHPHQMVREEAQFELAARKAQRSLAQVAKESTNRFARLHALWAIGMLPTNNDRILCSLAADPDTEIRANVAKLLGSTKTVSIRAGDDDGTLARSTLLKLIADPEPRVRYFAAISLSRCTRVVLPVTPDSDLNAYGPLFDLLKSNDNQDPYLRHAAVVGLASLAHNPVDLFNVWKLAKDKYDTPAVRLGVVLALRRHHSDRVGEFLQDTDVRVATEAARAVHDERIPGAMIRLAEMAEKPGKPDAIAYRALSANYKLGTPEAASRIAIVAARAGEPDHVRVFALKLLAEWAGPYKRDHVTGLAVQYPNQPIAKRPDAKDAAEAIRPVLAGIFSGSDAVRGEAGQVSAKLGIREVGPVLVKQVKDEKAPVSFRVDALLALTALKDPAAAEMTAYSLASTEPKLRATGLIVKAKSNPDEVLKDLPALLNSEKTSIVEKQAAFTVLATFQESEAADKLLDEWFSKLIAEKVPAELVLDIVEAAEKRTTTAKLKLYAPLKAKADQYKAQAAKSTDQLAPWAESLAGGDADKGRAIFLNNSAVYCQRCHKLDGQGGDVGPALNGLAAQPGKSRRYMLQSITLPSAQIAKGYETAILNLADGRAVSGIIKEETKKQIRLITPENKELVIPIEDVDSRRTGPSAMPDDLHKKLSRRELRDVVEFLTSLKEPAKSGGP